MGEQDRGKWSYINKIKPNMVILKRIHSNNSFSTEKKSFSWKKRKKRIFLKKEAKRRIFFEKEEKEEKEAEWDARLIYFYSVTQALEMKHTMNGQYSILIGNPNKSFKIKK